MLTICSDGDQRKLTRGSEHEEQMHGIKTQIVNIGNLLHSLTPIHTVHMTAVILS